MQIKFILLLFISSGCFITVLAQSEKGEQGSNKLFLDGSDFRIGLQLSDRFMVGGQLPSQFSSQNSSLREAMGVFSRYYLAGSHRKLRPYAQIGVNTDPFDNFDLNIETTLGLEYQLQPGISFNNELSYTTYPLNSSDLSGQRAGQLRGFLGSRPGVGMPKGAFSKGDWLISSELYEISWPGSSVSVSDYFQIRVNPTVSYALSKRWLLTGQLDFQYSSFKLESGRFNGVDADLYVGARYILLPDKKIKPYLSVGARYEFDYTNRPDQPQFPGGTFTEHLIRPEIGLGVLFPVGKNSVLDINFSVGPNIDAKNGWGINGKIGFGLRF